MYEVSEPKPRYRPISVADATAYDPLKGTHRVKRVTFQLADGTQSYVEVPHDEYTAEHVQRMLEHAADLHEQIMSISP